MFLAFPLGGLPLLLVASEMIFSIVEVEVSDSVDKSLV
jgi:hypothetical protein